MPVVRTFIGEEDVFSPRLLTVVGVVAVGAFLLSPALVPVGRWCLRDQTSRVEGASAMIRPASRERADWARGC